MWLVHQRDVVGKMVRSKPNFSAEKFDMMYPPIDVEEYEMVKTGKEISCDDEKNISRTFL